MYRSAKDQQKVTFTSKVVECPECGKRSTVPYRQTATHCPRCLMTYHRSPRKDFTGKYQLSGKVVLMNKVLP